MHITNKNIVVKNLSSLGFAKIVNVKCQHENGGMEKEGKKKEGWVD